MATVIRFARYGTKGKPHFRVVVQDKRVARNGRFIENIGTFIPTRGAQSLNLKRDRFEYWVSVGAQPSLSLTNRLKANRPSVERVSEVKK